MKNFMIAVGLLVTSGSAFAEGPFSPYRDLTFDCPGKTVLGSGYKVECKKAKGFKEIANSKVGENVQDPADIGIFPEIGGAVDLDILPDADSYGAYEYFRKLESKSEGKLTGLLSTSLWVNPEMEVKFKLKIRYNLEGKIVSIVVE
jgi:hypothetical protein